MPHGCKSSAGEERDRAGESERRERERERERERMRVLQKTHRKGDKGDNLKDLVS